MVKIPLIIFSLIIINMQEHYEWNALEIYFVNNGLHKIKMESNICYW